MGMYIWAAFLQESCLLVILFFFALHICRIGKWCSGSSSSTAVTNRRVPLDLAREQCKMLLHMEHFLVEETHLGGSLRWTMQFKCLMTIMLCLS